MNKAFFGKLKDEYTFFNQQRREIIGRSADALHKSKIAIFTIHRQQFEEAAKLLVEIESTLAKLEPSFKKSPGLRYEGSYKAAIEEYAEAKLLYGILVDKTLKPIKAVKLEFDSYLAGLCDVTGELIRSATLAATAGDMKQVYWIRDIITDILGELVIFNLTAYLRTKYDQAKGNLRKIEQMVYELSLKRS
jgi:translin